MKLGVNTYTMGFAGDTPAKLKLAGAIGFDGIEFQPDNFGFDGDVQSAGDDAKKVREALAAHKLAPLAVACDSDFVQPDQKEFDRWVRWGEYCAALSAKLGLKVVKYFAGEPKPGLSDGQIIDYMIRGSKELARIGGRYDVAFAEENHGRFTNRPEVQMRILKAAGSKRLGVSIDSSNYRWYGHPLADVHRIYREMAPYTLHVHIKDGDGRGGSMGAYKATALGEGELDIALLLAELAKNNYRGVLILEYEGSEGEAGVRRSFEYLRKLQAKALKS